MNKQKCCKIVLMNSKFRDNYYNTSSTNFSYKFPSIIKEVLSLKLRSIDIPNSWYTISEKFGNIKFYIVTEKLKIKEVDYPELVKKRLKTVNGDNEVYKFHQKKNEKKRVKKLLK